MSNEHLILCGSAKLSSRKKEWRNAKTVSLSTDRATGNVNLRISDLATRLKANLTELELDLLEIAAYVYAADQAVTRGGLIKLDYGLAWIRTFRFEVPVRKPDFWSTTEVREVLERTLSDASGDNFEIAFSKQQKPPPTETYFEWSKDDIAAVDEVMLFSGGLDSFGGAVKEAFTLNKKVALVSHRSAPQIASRQKELVSAIAERVIEPSKAPVHIPVWVNKAKKLGREHTQRTRSFLYATLGAVVARLFGLKQICFYENGVTSLNLPISAQVVSTRATRTTHPMVLSGFRRLFEHVIGEKFCIETPYFWKTKAEILREIKDAGYSKLCSSTISCVHTRELRKDQTHCGTCTQCIERCLVALAAGLNNQEDPPGMYRKPFLTSALEGDERVRVEAYLETFRKIQGFDNSFQFCMAYPEVGRVINHIGGTADHVMQKVFGLYSRHAKQVGDALDAEAKNQRAYSKLRLEQLPATCGFSMALPRGRSTSEHTLRQDNSTLGETADHSDAHGAAGSPWFDCDPDPDSKYKYGSVTGTLKDLAAWLDGPTTPTLRNRNGKSYWYIRKLMGRQFSVWFDSQRTLAEVNRRRLTSANAASKVNEAS